MSNQASNKKRKEMSAEEDTAPSKKSYEELEAENETIKAEIEALKKENDSLKAINSNNKDDNDNDISSDEEDDTAEDLNDPWTVKFHELREYRIIHGDCKASKKVEGPYKKLGRWLDTQRTARRKGKLSQEHIDKLDSLGMFWGKAFPTTSLQWEEQFEALQKYKTATGNCNIRIDPERPSPLAKWVIFQRMEYKRFRKGQDSLLQPEQIAQLKELGFKWKNAMKK